MDMSLPSFFPSPENRLCAGHCDMQQLIESFSSGFEQQLAGRGMVLCTRIRDPLPRSVRADGRAMARLFDSLADCSAPVSARGCAVLDIAAEPAEDERYSIYFVLTLSGDGLDAGQEQELFAGHTHGEMDKARLALERARTICKEHGGNIHIKNSPGFGTRIMAKICVADGVEGGRQAGKK